jgi:hypothetical protein
MINISCKTCLGTGNVMIATVIKMDCPVCAQDEIKIERVNDMCGGYVVATCGEISATVNMYETPKEAITRVRKELIK